MKRLLIAESSKEIIDALVELLANEWDIYICQNEKAIVDTLKELHLEAMIINLNLPQTDGISVLEKIFPSVPPIVLALSTYITPYIQQVSSSLGVGYILPLPCTASAVKNRLNSMYDIYSHSPLSLIKHFQTIGIDSKHNGYRYLIEAIQLFSKNRDLRLHKELYAQIVSKCGANSESCVERAIRTAIKAAWIKRDKNVWRYYFSTDKCPCNKEFIARFAEITSSESIEMSLQNV